LKTTNSPGKVVFDLFLRRDPIGYRGGINLYEYCGDDPLTGTDPLGLLSASGHQADKGPQIVCDGKGHTMIQVPEQPRDEKPDLFTTCGCLACMELHEQTHKDDADKAFPNVCKCGKKGESLKYDSPAEAKRFEVPACNREIGCLEDAKEKWPKKSKCQKIIQDRIDKVREYRDSFLNR
jgi:hypothetical protein